MSSSKAKTSKTNKRTNIEIDDFEEPAAQPEKKARVATPPPTVDHAVDNAVAPELQQSESKNAAISNALTQFTKPAPIKGLSSLVSEKPKLPPLEVLLRPLRTDQQDEVSTAIVEWWQNDSYFRNNKWGPKSNTCKAQPNKNSNIKWVDIKLLPQPPLIRSAIFVASTKKELTRRNVEASKERNKDNNNSGDGGEQKIEANKFFIKALILPGKDYISMEQQAYFFYVLDKICPTALLLMASSKVSFAPKAELAVYLTNDKKIRGTGKYEKLQDVPLDEPELIRIRNEWLESKQMSCSHAQIGNSECMKYLQFFRKCDSWVDGSKIPWGNLLLVQMAVFCSDGNVHTFRVDENKDIELLKSKAPFGIEHSVAMRSIEDDKGNQFKVELEMRSVTFFPQCASLMALCDQANVAEPAGEARKAAAKDIFASYQMMQEQQAALTHEAAPMETSSNNGDFGSYRA
jgi:hypothetical protein